MLNIRLTGVGGQGTVLAAKVLAQGFFAFGHIVHRKNFFFLGHGLLAHVLAQQLRLTDGQS